jgi:hypothetical protein
LPSDVTIWSKYRLKLVSRPRTHTPRLNNQRRTKSLLIAMLMHASYTTTTLLMEPVALSGAPVFINDIVTAALIWGVVAIVAFTNGGRLSRAKLNQRAGAPI